MCGITGIFNIKRNKPIEKEILKKMISVLAHRGPDDTGYFISKKIGLAQSRLSIIDIEGGKQPINNENNSIQVIFNGEIYNYIELREQLLKQGHHFRTKSDTEVIVHAYEEYGYDFVNLLNGQFAIALWDGLKEELILYRDRMGIRPLFYSLLGDGTFLFGSEMKAIFCHPNSEPEIDFAGINQIFTLWVNIPPFTVFKNVHEIPPGSYLSVSKNGIKAHRYWKLQFPDKNDYEIRPISYYEARVEELLYDAVTLRLRADVSVAAYLSGGIDSSIIASLVKKYNNNDLITFSVAFADSAFDERFYQMEMVNHLHTDHRMAEVDQKTIGKLFSEVIRLTEKPILRTAPVPLFMLSDLVRKNEIKVVLTGEGADEIFGGYNIFKEDKVRRFWAKNPESNLRPLLLSKLYPYINNNSPQTQNFWKLFFKKDLTDTQNFYYSHKIRWHNTAQIKKSFNKAYQNRFDDNEQIFHALNRYIDVDIHKWHPFSRAQYLEMCLFLPGYLLSSQGDRMMMGHSVEGRFPFLDHKLVEFANTIPPQYKMKVLNEKFILKKTFGKILPPSISQREKQPYRAPVSSSFLNKNHTIASSMLTEGKINSYKYFNPKYVEKLKSKIKRYSGKNITARDEMALVGIISTQLLHFHFIESGVAS